MKGGPGLQLTFDNLGVEPHIPDPSVDRGVHLSLGGETDVQTPGDGWLQNHETLVLVFANQEVSSIFFTTLEE